MLTSRVGYRKGEAVIILENDTKPGVEYCFKLKNAWWIRESDIMFKVCMDAGEVLYGMVVPGDMAKIAGKIENEIDALVSSVPFHRERKVIGDGTMHFGGKKTHFEIKE